MRKDIYVHKARPVGDARIEDLIIMAVESIPDIKYIGCARKIYQEDAQMICDALFETLPGGTMDQLLIKRLERRHLYLKCL